MTTDTLNSSVSLPEEAGATLTQSQAASPRGLHPRRERPLWLDIYQWVILVGVLLFLFVPLVGMLIFSVRFPLTGAWTGQAWQNIASFSGRTSSGTDMSLLWGGVINSLGLSALTVVIMLLLLLPTMLALKIRPSLLGRIFRASMVGNSKSSIITTVNADKPRD